MFLNQAQFLLIFIYIYEEIFPNIYEALEGCLSVDTENIKATEQDTVLEIVS